MDVDVLRMTGLGRLGVGSTTRNSISIINHSLSICSINYKWQTFSTIINPLPSS